MEHRDWPKGALVLAMSFGIITVTSSQSTLPNQWLQAEMIAHLNGMVDKYRKLVVPQLSQNYKELKVRSVKAESADENYLYVKFSVRVREINGLTGIVLGTSDGSAKGKFRWGAVEPQRVCIASEPGQLNALIVTYSAGIPRISSLDERHAAERAIKANFPRETCVPMWPRISVSDSTAPEFVRGQGRHPPRVGKLRFVVSLSNASARHVKVKYSCVDGSARAGIDYVPVTGELRLEAGQTSTAVEVKAIRREGNQGTRRMTLKLWSPINGKIQDADGMGTITDGG